MKKNKIFLVVMSLMMNIVVFSENITIEYATEMALKNNKKIKIQILELEKNKNMLNKAWRSALFSINYSGSMGKYFREIGFNDKSYNHNVSLVQPIYTGGAVKSAIELGKESLSLSELALEKTKKDIILNTLEAYIDVYNAQNTLEIYMNSKKNLEETYNIQRGKYKLKMITKPEYLESERSLKMIEASIISQRAVLDIAKEKLGNLIGIDGKNIEIVPFKMKENYTNNVDLNADLKKLKDKNIEYLMTLKGENISKENIDIERSSLRPKITGTLNYGTMGSKNKISELKRKENYNGTVGVNVTWNIFDWDSRKLDVRNAEKTYEISKIKTEQILEELQINMKNIFYKLQALEKNLEALKIAETIASETYELELERYNYRLITLNDLLRTENNLREVKINYLSTKLSYYYLMAQYEALLN